MSNESELVKRSRTSIVALVELLGDPRGVMYIGEPSIESLHAFISGWFWALNDRAVDQEVWDNFLEFVIKDYRNQPRSWKSVILFNSANSYDAYRNFFRYFERSVEQLKSTSPRQGL
jgi:hypothetical protein